MQFVPRSYCPCGTLLFVALLITPGVAQEPARSAKSRPAAADVSQQYLPRHPAPRDAAEKKIVAAMDEMYASQSRGMGNVLPEDGRLLRMLTETLGAKRVVEVGTANGYSAMWFCLALRSTGGRLTTCEIDSQRIALAKDNFRQAGVVDLVTLIEGDAHETLKTLDGPGGRAGLPLLRLICAGTAFPTHRLFGPRQLLSPEFPRGLLQESGSA